MSDIFVSYDDVDRARVRALVESLETLGWSVWWDHEISTGDAFSLVIERELDAAACVIVAWTDTSVESAWVRAEASEAWKHGKLVPVLLDRVSPPMPFRQIQAADLVDWEEEGHPGFAKLIGDLRKRIGDPRAASPQGAPVPPGRTRRALIGGGAALLLAAVAVAYAVGGWRPAGDHASGEAAVPGMGVSSPAAGALLDPNAADASSAAASAALAGHWQAEVAYPDGATFVERFAFDVAGGRLSGTASMRGYGNRRGLLEAAVGGNRLSFGTRGHVQLDLATVREVAYRYDGVLEGDSIRFSVVEEGTGDPPFGFVARRISAEQAARIATGGTRPRLSGMSTNGLYSPDHIRQVIASRQGALAACYEAAEFDPVNHEFVGFELTLSASGALQRLEMRPQVESLDRCVRDVLTAAEWGRTETGAGGTMQLSIDARLPWNP